MSVRADGSATGGSGGVGPGQGVGDWNPPTPDKDLAPTGAFGANGNTRGVWYLRPRPLNQYQYAPGRTAVQAQAAAEAYLSPENNYSYYKPSELAGAYESLDPSQQAWFDAIAKSTNKRSTGSGLFEKLLQRAQYLNSSGDNRANPFDLAADIARQRGLMNDAGEWIGPALGGGSSSSGGGAYRGPVTTVTRLNDADARILADSVGAEVLGRAVTEDEFQRVLKKLRAGESANPSVSGGAGASQTNVSGLSSEGRTDLVTKALLKEDGAKEFTLATKMLGLFNKALSERPDAG